MGKPRIAKNDDLIKELLLDPGYQVRKDGTVWRLAERVWRQTGLAKTNKNGKQYYHLKYKGKNLLVSRIVAMKYFGKLDPTKVIHHIRGSLTNAPRNLEECTQRQNTLYAKAGA